MFNRPRYVVKVSPLVYHDKLTQYKIIEFGKYIKQSGNFIIVEIHNNIKLFWDKDHCALFNSYEQLEKFCDINTNIFNN